MTISTTSIHVEDQATACTFYTGKLGVHVKRDIPLGEYRWLTHPSGTWV